jgi:hypothetical protein
VELHNNSFSAAAFQKDKENVKFDVIFVCVISQLIDEAIFLTCQAHAFSEKKGRIFALDFIEGNNREKNEIGLRSSGHVGMLFN